MAKGNSIDKEDPSVNDQGFKKTETTITPSANKEPIEDVNAKLMHEAPVHGSNVLNQSHGQQNGNKHDRDNKGGGH